MKKVYSLKKRLVTILAGIALVVFIAGIFNVAVAFRGFTQLRSVWELFAAYSAYGSAAEEIQDALVSYYSNDSEENQETLTQLAQSMAQLALQMEALSEDAQFTDMRYLSDAYTEQAEQYVQGSDACTVQEIRHMGELVLLEYDMLQVHVEEIVDTSIAYNTHIWEMQLLVTILMAAVTLVYVVAVSLHLSGKLLRPITALTDSIRRFQKTGDAVKVCVQNFPETCYEELLVLQNAYLEMTETIAGQIVELEDKIRLSDELRKKETALANAEFGLMQSLINPHFLYNCLSTISALSRIEHAPRTYKSTILIASFLRKALNNVGKQVTVEEEMEYTQEYIEIQKLRFADGIDFCISWDHACAEAVVPAILLQPLIENSIQHGVKNMGSGAKISAEVRLTEGRIVMRVTDNGAGFSEKKLAEVRQILQCDYEPEQNGVGMRSVAYRLRKVFGNKASMRIESVPGNTEIRLELPSE